MKKGGYREDILLIFFEWCMDYSPYTLVICSITIPNK